MINFSLQSKYKISGLGACSGLVFIKNILYVISDNSTFLYEYDIDNQHLNKIPLFKNSEENIPKKQKPDFESIAKKGKKLCIFGSGSTKNRELMVTYHLKKRQAKTIDTSFLYDVFKQKFNISNDDFNIEGVIYHKKTMLLFQRGNDSGLKNGIIKIDNELGSMTFHDMILPKVNNIQASFTDAVLVGKKIYFLAAVENTDSTYDDGEILGTFLGCMKFEDFELIDIQKISDDKKFEGITLVEKAKNSIQFLLCEDNDTENLETEIYQLIVEK